MLVTGPALVVWLAVMSPERAEHRQDSPPHDRCLLGLGLAADEAEISVENWRVIGDRDDRASAAGRDQHV